MAHGLAKYGHEVTVIARAAETEKIEMQDNVHVHRILPSPKFGKIRGLWRFDKYWPGFAWAALGRLRAIHKTTPIHLVDAPEGRADSLFLPLQKSRPKIVVRLHTALVFADQISETTPTKRHKVQYWQEKMAIRSADAITAPTQAMLDLTETWVKLKQKRVGMIPNPVNTKTFSPAEKQIPELPEILYVGRLEHRKIFILAQALSQILRQNAKLNIRFIGKDGPDNNGNSWRERILATVPSTERQRVSFEHVTREELPRFYRNASFSTLPSVWENFPYAILESMACGTPAVCTRVGGYPELIQENVSGVLVPPADPNALADAICNLANDPAQCAQMGARARERVLDYFSVERIVPQMLDFYEQVLN